ncbi:protein ORF147D [Cyprinid herpesvirus 1]|uniref:Protein ORF147D n=1 Tax=Cyprinid herpesvirus 1 TaxID=317858 RepID=K7PBE8_9VIRU|nr:protein ORF147D [Cyprinid herpesvirus 1]AFJ20454.1 protein ORF147D [Cyprinid herpesvirus 1]
MATEERLETHTPTPPTHQPTPPKSDYMTGLLLACFFALLFLVIVAVSRYVWKKKREKQKHTRKRAVRILYEFAIPQRPRDSATVKAIYKLIGTHHTSTQYDIPL